MAGLRGAGLCGFGGRADQRPRKMQVRARGEELWDVARTKLGTGIEVVWVVKSFSQGVGDAVGEAILGVVVSWRL